jgi:hypothetical protein
MIPTDASDSHRPFSCDAFVAHVVELAACAVREPHSEGRRRHVAEGLLARYVRTVRVLGVDVRGVIVGRRAIPNAAASGSVVSPAVKPTGFDPALVSGGQGGEALSHLAAAAAAVLMGKPWLVWGASVFDWLQGFVRRDRAQARAEVKGNRSGARVGEELVRFLDDPDTTEGLRDRIARLVCDAASDRKSA